MLFFIGVNYLKRKVKIGIPRALAYYSFYPLWRAFLEKLGAEVIVSKKTNRRILEDGIKETVNDACIPIKVFHGHVYDLVGLVDYIFIPRMVSADGKSTFCPKFLGLPDMVRYSDVKLPTLVDVRFNRKGSFIGLPGFFNNTAKAIGVRNPFLIFQAALAAFTVHKKYQALLAKGFKPVEAIDIVFDNERKQPHEDTAKSAVNGINVNKDVTVALLGYPYAIYDSYISAGVYPKLLQLGVQVITFEQIPLKEMRRYARVMPQNFFWYYSNQVCWAGLYLLDQPGLVDGIIHVTAFGCGPDAMVDKTLELEAKKAGVPFLSMAIDEHTGQGGVQTRLEAFTDMLLARKRKSVAG